MQSAWAQEIASRAQAHWTPARLDALTQGKTLAFLPNDAAPLLRALGLLGADGSLPPSQVRKYFQINHMVAVLGPSLRELMAEQPVVRIVDAACGRSYLTLLLAWCLRHRYAHPVEVLGIDRNASLIRESRRRSALVGLDESLRFEEGDLENPELAQRIPAMFGNTFSSCANPAPIHAVVALHACDTATDSALAMGLELGAKLIAAAPCCHAEVARQWEAHARVGGEGPLAPLQRSPHLRREAGATITDALRGLLLAAAGYDVSTLEFVPSEHTPKNTLLRAMHRGAPRPEAWAEYVKMCKAVGSSGIRLEHAMPLRLRPAVGPGESPL